MNPDKIINAGKVAMLRGKGMSPKQIDEFIFAVGQKWNDDKVEVMLLFMAEALHDIAGYGIKRTGRILRSVDDRLSEWEEEGFDIDKLRLRVFQKTNYIFTCNEEERHHIIETFENGGYKICDESPDGRKKVEER